jgi:hypothetical protein
MEPESHIVSYSFAFFVHSLFKGCICDVLITNSWPLAISCWTGTVYQPTCLILQRFGNTGSVSSRIDSYLATRTLSSTLCSGQTEPFPVDGRVSRASVLGPLRFICFTEDVKHVCEQERVGHHIFADDKQMYASGWITHLPDIRRQLQC